MVLVYRPGKSGRTKFKYLRCEDRSIYWYWYQIHTLFVSSEYRIIAFFKNFFSPFCVDWHYSGRCFCSSQIPCEFHKEVFVKCHCRVCWGILHSFCCLFSLGGAVKHLSWSHFMLFPSCAQRSAFWSTFLLQTSVCLALFVLSSTLTNLKIEALKSTSILGCCCHASLFPHFTTRKALDRRWAVETASFVSTHCHDLHVSVE